MWSFQNSRMVKRIKNITSQHYKAALVSQHRCSKALLVLFAYQEIQNILLYPLFATFGPISTLIKQWRKTKWKT